MKRKAFRDYMNSILEERSSLDVLETVSQSRNKRKTPNFRQYLREQLLLEEVNAHMTHIEDLVFNAGVDGTRQAINFFRDLRDMLAGHSKTKTNLTIKYDGCIHEDTVVCTDKGEMRIEDLLIRLNEGETIKALGMDMNSNEVSYCNILGHSAKDGEKDWVEIELENGETIKLTEDHKVHTGNRGWVEAGNLTEEDDITEI